MYEKGRISVSQFFIWLLIYLSAAASTNNLDILVTRQDAFIPSLLSILPGILTIFLLIDLQRKYPGKSFFSTSEEILGRWLGKIVTLIYLYFCLELCTLYVRGFGEFVVTVMTPELSVDIYLISIVLVGAYAVYVGIESIARVTQLLFPFYILILIFINLLLIGQFDLDNIRPFLDHSLGKIMYTSLLQYVFPMGEVIFFLGVIPYVKESRHVFKAAMSSIILAGVFLAYRAFVSIGVLGQGTAIASNYPYFNAIRLVKIGEFVERIDVFFLGIFVIAVLIQFTTVFYALSHGLAHLFKVKSVRTLAFPLAFFIFAISGSTITNVVEINDYLMWVRPITGPFYMLVLPAILWTVSFIKRKKESSSELMPTKPSPVMEK